MFFFDQFNVPDEKLVIERFKAVMEQNGIKQSDLKDMLQWSFSKMSKIMSGTQNAKFSELAQIALALGYPLEAFIGEDFNIADYEKQNPPMPLKACFDAYFDGYPCDDVVEEMIDTELPYTLRRLIKVNWRQFTMVHRCNKFEDPFCLDGSEPVEFRPFVALKPQKLHTTYDDYLQMGYWIGKDRRTVMLGIVYHPDSTRKNATYSAKRREEYKSYIHEFETESFDMLYGNYDLFHHRTEECEICSVMYDFSTNITEDEMIQDLRKMYEVYLRVVEETANEVELMVWKTKTEEKLSHAAWKKSIEPSVEIDKTAKERAGYKCEIDASHTSFLDKNGKNYMEVIRLIPLDGEIDVPEVLDIEENAICLCPLCKSRLQNGKDEDREEMLVSMYYKRKDALSKKGITVSLRQTLGAHGM